MDHESIAVICSSIAGVLTLLIGNYFSNRKLQITIEQARLDREQDRLDRLADKNQIINAGDERKNQIVQEVKQVRTVAVKSALKSEEALRVANGHNEKIKETVEVAKEAIVKLSNPNA